jgi:hypothetical protein
LSYPATRGFRMRRIRAVMVVAPVAVLAAIWSIVFVNTKPAAELKVSTTGQPTVEKLRQPAPPTTTTAIPPTTVPPPPTTAATRPVKALQATEAAPTPPVVRENNSGPTDEQLRQLRMCESGGNYQANTGNGYYGAYQFLPSTWRSMGTGYDMPHTAPASVQDDAARRLIQRSGWGQFPACARKMGMR